MTHLTDKHSVRFKFAIGTEVTYYFLGCLFKMNMIKQVTGLKASDLTYDYAKYLRKRKTDGAL